MSDKQKIVVIVGPTSSGKSELGVSLAKHLNQGKTVGYSGAEIISADSRQVYKGLNLGTGKITPEEMGGIKHHMLDIASPLTRFTVNDYKEMTDKILVNLKERNIIPIVVGGSGFYVDVLLGRATTAPALTDIKLRSELEEIKTEELALRLKSLDYVRWQDIDKKNRPRLIRAIEIATTIGHIPRSNKGNPYQVLIIGIITDKESLKNKIRDRIILRINQGMIDEVEELMKSGLSYERMQELGLEYRYIAQHLRGVLTMDEMIDMLTTKTIQYSKRQMTWFNANKEIVWVDTDDHQNILNAVDDFLNKP